MVILFLAAGIHFPVSVKPAGPPGLPDAPGASWPGVAIEGLRDGLPSYAQSASGSSSAPSVSEAAATDAPQLTMFDHQATAPWFVGGQTNVIFQANAPFHSPYQGTNSFHNAGEYKTSLLGTLFTAVELGPLLGQHETRYTGEFAFQMESSGGRGLSNALGLAGFTNLDVVRNPNLGSKPYVARAILSGTLGLTEETVTAARTPLSLATVVPARRFVLHAGKMSLPDFFDQNDVLSDSHLQFTNWTVDDDGAWDYAADTRGYTYGTVLEYDDRQWSARYGLALMPTVANGIHLDWALRRARAQNMEFEWRHGFLPGHEGVQRALVFVNNAHMGVYREAVDAFLDGQDPTPEITAHEHFGDVKYGFGYNVEQQITTHMRAGARFGWNAGQHESYAYTEDDQTVLAGGDYDGAQWGRDGDKFGLAFVSNAIKRDHQNYLADGGLGFILGDGRLNYGRENITETYYNAHAWRGMFFALGLSHISSPGYNRDRGPVWVPSIRSHIDF
jgi:high affinity Mn2+ porin